MNSSKNIVLIQQKLIKLENLHSSFDYLKIAIASPEKIRSWAERKLPNGEIVGEVKRPETINFRSHQPEIYGLFCEKIFGPVKNWKCRCGKYNGYVSETICELCDVELTESRVRRYRMGYLQLTCPILHFWYLKGIPNYLLLLLKCIDEKYKISEIEDLIYFRKLSTVTEDENDLNRFLNETKEIKDFSVFQEINKKKKKNRGAEILKVALDSLNLPLEISKRRFFIQKTMSPSKIFSYKKIYLEKIKIELKIIRILESFLATKTKPSWMILTSLPILPPSLRPLMELENKRLVAADINEIYRLIITRNTRLFEFLNKYMSPDLISIQSRKLLQESVDCLIDNSRLPKSRTFYLNNKPLKGLTEILEGKLGRFRLTLLGKRVDYSGRSVIIVGPNLRLNQFGLPYEMAIKLFEPFLIHELLETKIKPPSYNIRLARVIISKRKPFIWTLLEKLSKKYSLLLNRAPTLHRFGIQAFDPVLILGQAIHLHPLVCTGFNADFDGDQMAVHLPLSNASQVEVKAMMRPSNNVLSPSNGEVILKPTQDMVIGSYYLTLLLLNKKTLIKKWFPNETSALVCFYQKKLSIHSPIFVRYSLIDFFVELEKDFFFLSDFILSSEKQKVLIYKTFQFGQQPLKYYFLTNVGIFIGRITPKGNYQLTDFFLETTPGRLIFSVNLKIILKLTL